MKQHCAWMMAVLACVAIGCSERATTPDDAAVDSNARDANAPDAGERDLSSLVTRPRSTACIDLDIGSAVGEGLGMTRFDALDDDVPRALCATDLYRICNGILPAESGLLWEATEGGFYEFRARGTNVINLALDIATFDSAGSVACRDQSDVSVPAEVGVGQVPTDVGWFCSCEYVPPSAGATWSTTPLRTVVALAPGSRVLLTVEANASGSDSELGVDIRRVESCDNDVDDDGDGDIDCRDSDCPFSNYGVSSDVCNERNSCAVPAPGLTCCSNGIDDDGDGKTDCVDQQCSGTDTCVAEFECGNGLDDDLDLHIDCDDADCRFSEPCYDFSGPGESNCSDGLDDDADGDIDCDDSDCVYPGSECFGVYENAFVGECDDGLDNDGDGRVDCADVDCRRDSFSCLDIEVSCVDGIDNDLDDATDCADTDCRFAASCVEVECGNDIDDDGDSRIDCNDSDCACYGDCPCL